MSKLKIFIFITSLITVIGVSTYFLLRKGHTFSPNIRYLRGGSCNDNDTCHHRDVNSFCDMGPDNSTLSSCQCNTDFVLSYDRKRCLEANIPLGGPCQETQQCSYGKGGFSHILCVYGSDYCGCDSGYIPSDDLSRCLPIVDKLEWQSCKEDGQCQLGTPGPFSKCVKQIDKLGVCKCDKGAVNEYGDHTCYPVAKYAGSPCKIHAQCVAGFGGHSRCVEDRCICSPGYVERHIGNGTYSCVESHGALFYGTTRSPHF